jgi:hypothetical protein
LSGLSGLSGGIFGFLQLQKIKKTGKMKIIEVNQPVLIQCDNLECNYTIPNPTGDPATETKQYINMPCPDCGENLLTQEDYDQAARVLKIINWLNKWFGWLAFFTRKKRNVNATVHIHNGINIKTEDHHSQFTTHNSPK